MHRTQSRMRKTVSWFTIVTTTSLCWVAIPATTCFVPRITQKETFSLSHNGHRLLHWTNHQYHTQCRATSSSDLKKYDDGTTKKNSEHSKRISSNRKRYPKTSVVSRLKQAAKRASAQAKKNADDQEKDENNKIGAVGSNGSDRRQPSSSNKSTNHPHSNIQQQQPPKLGSLRQLTAAIDLQLSESRAFGHISQPARDSMTAVVKHNVQVEKKEEQQNSNGSSASRMSVTTLAAPLRIHRKNVAVILAKSLRDDLVTVEYAIRMQRLIRSMKDDEYKPDMICFVAARDGCVAQTATTTSAKKGLIHEVDAGYMYFKHLALNLQMDISNIEFQLVRTDIQGGGLRECTLHIQDKRVRDWMDAVHEVNHRPRLKLQVQFTIVSSEYHLCILNDIHVRSPGQSPLAAFDRWSVPKGKTSNARPFALETSWTYLYATTSSLRTSDDPIVAFATECYHRAQDLRPVLQNLRGVVSNLEFFQRDNYRVLVQARRCLVQDMEELYQQQPSLAAVHKVLGTGTNIPLDIVLEGALLSLGRCLDLVRPAGLLTGSVPASDFVMAATVLEQAVTQISTACDPDQPLDAKLWGTLLLHRTPSSSKSESDQTNELVI